MKKCKKTLALVMVITLIVLSVPFAAGAAGSYYYSVLSEKDKTAVITTYTGSAEDLTVPSTVGDGYKVQKIGDGAFSYCKSLKSVTVPDGVTYIGDSAFEGCTNLKSVNFPDSVQTIGDRIFYDCVNLTDVILGSGVTKISRYAFYNCDSLKDLSILDGISVIGAFSFQDCDGLTELNAHKNITTLGAYSFADCDNLAKITLADNITEIYNSAFLETAFYKNESNWEDGILYIGKYLIDCKYVLGDCTVKEGTLILAGGAFKDCDTLSGITIPGSVIRICDGAFMGCTNLRRVYVSDFEAWCKIRFDSSTANPMIYSGSFYIGGKEAKDLVIPDGITRIEDFAFINFSKINSITVPTSVEYIGDNSFANCPDLIIYGEEGSYVQSYAEKNKLTFVLIGTNPPETGIFVFKIDNSDIYYVNQDVKFTAGSAATFDENKKTIVPLRAIAAATGVNDLKYDAATKKITFTGFDGYSIEMQTGSTICKISKGTEKFELSIAAPFTKDGSAMLPLRDTTNLVGGYVKYDNHYIVVSKDDIADEEIPGYIAAYNAK